MSGSTSITRPKDEAKYGDLSKGPQSGIELEGDMDWSRDDDITSQKNALMEKMRLLRIPRDDQSDLASNTQYSRNSKARRSLRLGSLSSCNIDDDIEEKLWDMEANRLPHGLENNEGFLEATSTPMIPEEITGFGFAQLEYLADRLLCILAIYGLHDQNALSKLERSQRIEGTSQDIAIVSHS
ncbi:hypothetical protein BDP81DRAFT_396270 [Colletotrichum phormii]|uniref:Uncharacterized protein n=1 Tax=Colletotrichum phormii TaxID=359342 RepID=A0AAI9ZMA5_9PEZI|nr:uncharacterized protein BDP81DRAFT_396270 [Colletotrichum phormii]KAK1634281.1 hypothetical protein BDP81DRAFT_396270 [Colletotrichum phormii]